LWYQRINGCKYYWEAKAWLWAVVPWVGWIKVLYLVWSRLSIFSTRFQEFGEPF
jgi:hypothetical protein